MSSRLLLPCCRPEVQKYLHKMEEERKKTALNKDQDNRSFIQKYVSTWM